MSRPPIPEASRTPARRRRRFRRVRLLPAVALIGALVLAGWAASTPGGIPARIGDLLGRARDTVDAAFVEPNLKGPQRYLDSRYETDGVYPHLTEIEAIDDDAIDWGIGTRYVRCSDHLVIVRSLTARGTVSRLLVAGESWGDVDGAPPCPGDPRDPSPWVRPEDAG